MEGSSFVQQEHFHKFGPQLLRRGEVDTARVDASRQQFEKSQRKGTAVNPIRLLLALLISDTSSVEKKEARFQDLLRRNTAVEGLKRIINMCGVCLCVVRHAHPVVTTDMKNLQITVFEVSESLVDATQRVLNSTDVSLTLYEPQKCRNNSAGVKPFQAHHALSVIFHQKAVPRT